MEREQLAGEMLARGCTRGGACGSSDTRYPSQLLRCTCSDRALAVVPSGEKRDRAVKLFGAALSWHLSNGWKGPLTFVLAADVGGHWRKSLHAIQMLQPQDRDVDLQVDFKPVPDMCDVDLSSPSWVTAMLDVERRTFPPSAGWLAHCTRAIDAFAWYRAIVPTEWSGRLDGLEVCTLSLDGKKLTFKVGKPGSRGTDSGARSAFQKIAADHESLFGALNSDGQLELGPGDEGRAADILRVLAASDIATKGSNEHRLEARVLRGEVILRTEGGPLNVVPEEYSFQFPTRWWPDGPPRYVDVMAQQGPVPWVVELKVSRSQGEYYRDGIVQAALYRQYVLRSAGLDPWFASKGMNRLECRAALVVPPLRGVRAAVLREDHRAVADLLGVTFIEDAQAESVAKDEPPNHQN